ncbi:NAD(P)-dependent oxidoreductase [Microbulbifer flavimaris]|uniref:NAD(P)-dependent oxidoreductase n=1 Tax=Microbulbifer flavimaris TaxID=1781068 RepID=A0ABX4I273_9GAMM|nr:MULTISPECIES: SDR family oxidoreductase [Microbulbifer]KUJ84194.1 oxidoreductase [Microbulbifer sp. ZGT114]PCO06268.1 NAD(P)-dependent oxidoreductase [Microbulbifer flavimaris]
MRLQGKVAVATGVCGGIGLSIVRKLVNEGARVVAVDLSQESLDKLQKDYGDEVVTVAADVTRYDQVEAMIQKAVDHFGQVDILINNAGIASPKPLLEHDPDKDFDGITAVNQKGVYHGILAAGKAMKKQGRGGVIINTSSVYGTMASELSFTYNVSKAAVDMMTKCAALEYGPQKIRVCAVAPGRVDTPMLHQYKDIGLWDHIKREQMRNEFTQPEEIADVIAFLASDEANCINGTTVSAGDGFESFKYPLLPG